MTDGINGLFLGLSIISFSYIYISYETNYSSYLFWIIVILFVLFFLNQLNFFFMGDSGVYLISTILGICIMSAYNSKFSNIKTVEEIFLLLCIPGIDMFRLFITRLSNKKNPFKPDRNHFHHLLQLKFNDNWTICAYFLLTLMALLLQYIDINIIYSIFILIAIYLYLIWFLKKI
jgi:UDP-GlcNAc:undecaprenyl-phosphate GlcNAc-1-phosphate transferase